MTTTTQTRSTWAQNRPGNNHERNVWFDTNTNEWVCVWWLQFWQGWRVKTVRIPDAPDLNADTLLARMSEEPGVLQCPTPSCPNTITPDQAECPDCHHAQDAY